MKNVIESWEKDGIGFEVVLHELGHYCGYARFPKRPLREQGYSGIATYVPVHGGITYALTEDHGSFIYGFDCAHAGDEGNPKLKSVPWLKSECERMALNIKASAKYERRYLRAISEKGKAKILQEFHDEVGGFDLKDNFGAMINTISGKI